MKNEPYRFGEESKWTWVLLATALFVVRVMPYAMAELWYDEVLTLTDFVLGSGGRGIAASVLRNYTMANNHILNNALYWGWVRVLGFNVMPENLLRLPSLLLGAGTVWLCILHWRKWLGARTSVLGGIILALSPVFTAYAYQIRGYSMTMLLSALCISGALEFHAGNRLRGHFVGCAAGLLLPLVMPSNVLLAPLAAVLYECPLRSLKEKLRAALPVLAAFALGASYYLTLWSQFLKTTREPAGWESAWGVFGNLSLAALSLVLPLIPSAWNHACGVFRRLRGGDAGTHDSNGTRLSLWVPALLLGPVVLAGAALILSRSGQAPYPRVFLVFLPQILFAFLLMHSRAECASGAYLVLLGAIVLNALLWERIPSEMTHAALKRGVSPSNLLQQYYRGSTELREATGEIHVLAGGSPFVLITDEYDFPTSRFYVLLRGLPAESVTTLNRSRTGFWTECPAYRRPRLFILAKTEASAMRLAAHAGVDATPRSLKKLDIRTIYTTDGK